MGKGKANRGKKRISSVVALIDGTTYCDPYSREKKRCIVIVNEPESGKDQWRMPRIRIPLEILDKGPRVIGDRVREQLSRRMGLTIKELIFEEEITDADRTFMLFKGPTVFVGAMESDYAAVEAKCIEEIRAMYEHGKMSRFHYETARRVLTEVN